MHTDTWVYKKSKHEFCVLASKHALWCENRSSVNKNCHRWWKSTQIELFWDLFYTSLYGDFTVDNQVFPMYLLSTQVHTIHYVSTWVFYTKVTMKGGVNRSQKSSICVDFHHQWQFSFNEDLFLHHKACFEAKTQNSCLEFLYTHVSVCSVESLVPGRRVFFVPSRFVCENVESIEINRKQSETVNSKVI